MNILIGKIENSYKKILTTDDNILTIPIIETSNSIEYLPGYKLDEEEWFVINQFSEQEFFIEECKTDYSSTSLNQIDNNDYGQITCLCIIEDSNRYFQRVTPSLYVNKKTILDYSGDPKIVKYNKQIEVKEFPDAIVHTVTNSLYFRDLSKLKSIFPGIDSLQREATQPEVDSFMQNDFISLDGYSSTSVGTQNRKRIADIGKKFKNLSKAKQKKLIEYAKDKSGIELINGSFIINSDSQLKNLLYAMDQRYYYADIYEENRIANSIRVVN